MESSSSSLERNCENSVKQRNLLFSMDYDSGYMSHNPESNFDSSSDNNENLLSALKNRPIYLSEDALLETPEVNKYSNISVEIEKEDFEETRHVFNSPFLNNSTTEISASVGSREISYSGFETEGSNSSVEIPSCKPLRFDSMCIQGTKVMYSSPDLNDLKREVFKDLQQFNKNIVNSMSTNDPKKKLTLIISKDDKENAYSVKRKYRSLTPDRGVNDQNVSHFLSTSKQGKYLPTEITKHDTTDVSRLSVEIDQSLISTPDKACTINSSFSPDLSNAALETSNNETPYNSSQSEFENAKPCKLSCSPHKQRSETDQSISFIQEKSYINLCVNQNISNITLAIGKKETMNNADDIEYGNGLKVFPGTPKKCEIDQCPISTFQQHSTNLNIKSNIFNETLETTKSETKELTRKVEYENAIHVETFPCSSKNLVNEIDTSIIMTPEKSCTSSVNSNLCIVPLDFEQQKTSDLISKTECESTINLKKFPCSPKKLACEIPESIISTPEKSCTNQISSNLDPNLCNNVFKKHETINLSNRENVAAINFTDFSCSMKQLKKLPNEVGNSVISTPEKSYTNPINSSLSPDLFTEDVVEDKLQEIVQPTTSTPKERNMVKKDYMILRRTQNNLKGVIPPRSITTMHISVAEMLNKLENNKKYFWNSSTDVKCNQPSNLDSLLVTCSVESCKDKEFPAILKDRCFGLYHNRSKFSEEFEELCAKYGQRYVGAETQSSCTVFETHSVSPMKRKNLKPQWSLKSPGKRLSHLARRRITFSSVNLQSRNSFLAGSRARQILVDAKKIDLLSRRKSPRKSPRKTPKKTPGKSPRLKSRTPSSSAKKKLAMRFRKVTGEIEKSTNIMPVDSSLSAKRNLFDSPDEKLNRLLPSACGISTAKNDIKMSTTKRALFMSPSKSSPLKNMGFKPSPVKRLDFGLEKKRKRIDSVNEPPSKFARCFSESVPSSSESDVKSLAARARSDLSISQTKQLKEISTNQKKKLQLAVYEALRSQNVLPTHPQFKVLASNLGRLTRRLFLLTTADCVGVTEKMLRIARYHVIAVVKGKSPEEIYEEFLKSRSRNVKPQGYVAPEKPKEDKIEVERRVMTGKSNCSNDSKVDRIRKAINFGDDDNR